MTTELKNHQEAWDASENNNEIPRFAPLKYDWKGQMEQKIKKLVDEWVYSVPMDKEIETEQMLWQAILFGQSHMKQMALNLITEEIADAHTEGAPTSRLTSLYNKLSALNDLKI